MEFLALIAALLLMHYMDAASRCHRDRWFVDWQIRAGALGLGTLPALLLLIALPVLLLILVLDVSGSLLLGLAALLLNIVVLLYSFGRGDFEALLERYRRHCKEDDFEAAWLYAREHLEWSAESDCPLEQEELHRWMKQRVLYLGFERWFAVIFYFAVLGAPAALAYRLLQLARDHSDDEPTLEMLDQVLHWVDWLPSRLLCIAFALTGDWMASREHIADSLRRIDQGTGEVLSNAAHAALGLKVSVFSDGGDSSHSATLALAEIDALHQLLKRSAVAWVVSLALVVLLV